MTASVDPIAAIEQHVEDWQDFVHSLMRAREYAERTLRSGDAVLAVINRHNAARGLPPVGEG